MVTNDDLARRLDTSDEWIVERTGIRTRRVVTPADTNSGMAVAAAREALGMAGVRPRDLDLILVATSSPDFLTPPVSSQVQHMLGAKDVGAMTLVVGCPGFVYGLVTAQQYIASGACDTVLLIGVEIITRFVNPQDRTTAVLFGDGAGAVVLRASDRPCGVLSFVLGSDGSGAEHLIVPSGGSTLPPSADTLAKGLNYLHMNGPEVFKFATRVLGHALRQAIARAGLTPEDIDLFIPHQANARIIESAARQAGLPREKVFVNIHAYGNTSAASIPIALCEAIEQGRAKPGDTLAFVAFGAGLTWGAAVVKLGEGRPHGGLHRPTRLPNWLIGPARAVRQSIAERLSQAAFRIHLWAMSKRGPG